MHPASDLTLGLGGGDPAGRAHRRRFTPEAVMTEKLPLLLYVEDDTIVSMAVAEALEEAGFELEHAIDGKEALSALQARAQQFRALVTDVRLPEIDGWAVAHLARELNPAIPVVYVSGDGTGEWSANGVPNSLMLQKPFALAQLVAAVTTLLNEAAAAMPPASAPE
jgi:DNA-binding response OmpR family regulator